MGSADLSKFNLGEKIFCESIHRLVTEFRGVVQSTTTSTFALLQERLQESVNGVAGINLRLSCIQWSQFQIGQRLDLLGSGAVWLRLVVAIYPRQLLVHVLTQCNAVYEYVRSVLQRPPLAMFLDRTSLHRGLPNCTQYNSDGYKMGTAFAVTRIKTGDFKRYFT